MPTNVLLLRRTGLSLTLHPEMQHYIADTMFVGTIIFVHGPFEYPDTKVSYLMGSPGTDVNIAVIPNVVESSNEIRSLPMPKRRCYYQNEVVLYHFIDQSQLFIEFFTFRKSYKFLGCIAFRDV